jgi:hypothetical protein
MKHQQLLELWRGHIEACRASGLQVTEYCKKHSLATRRYYYWKLRVERADKSSGEKQTSSGKALALHVGQWLCVEPEAGQPAQKSDALTVRIGGAEIDVYSGFNASLLRSVVQALGTQPC